MRRLLLNVEDFISSFRPFYLLSSSEAFMSVYHKWFLCIMSLLLRLNSWKKLKTVLVSSFRICTISCHQTFCLRPAARLANQTACTPFPKKKMSLQIKESSLCCKWTLFSSKSTIWWLQLSQILLCFRKKVHCQSFFLIDSRLMHQGLKAKIISRDKIYVKTSVHCVFRQQQAGRRRHAQSKI